MSSVLGPDETLRQDTSLVSPNQEYELVMQGDGNLVVYRRADSDARTPLWSAWESPQWKYPSDRPRQAEGRCRMTVTW